MSNKYDFTGEEILVAKPTGLGLFETLLIATPGYVVVLYFLLFIHLFISEDFPTIVPSWLTTSLILLVGVIVGYFFYATDLGRWIDKKWFGLLEEIRSNITGTLSQPCRECTYFRNNRCKGLIWDEDALWDLFYYYVDSKLPSMWRDLAFWTGPIYFLVIYIMIFSLIFLVLSCSLLTKDFLVGLDFSAISLSLTSLHNAIMSMSLRTSARIFFIIVAFMATIVTFYRLRKGRVGFLKEINRRQLRFIQLDPGYRHLVCKIAFNQLSTVKEKPLESRKSENEEIRHIKHAYSRLALKAPKKLPKPVPELDDVAKAIQLKKDSFVLDMGCGYGRNTRYFYKRGMRIIGVDYDLNQLKKAIEYARKQNHHLEVINADIRYLPFRNLLFDLVLLNSTIFHFPTLSTRKRILRSTWETLKPTGYCLIDIQNLLHIPHFLKAIRMYFYVRYKKWLFGEFGDSYIIDKNTDSGTLLRRFARFQTTRELAKLLNQTNFRIMKICGFKKQKKIGLLKEIRASRISILSHKF